MTLSQRIKLIRKTLDLSQTIFAAEIGITQTSLSQIESGKNGISYDVYKAIITRFKVDPFWLMEGNGEMFRKPDTQRSGSVLPLVVTVADDGEENIVMVDRKAAAGYLRGAEDPTYFEKLPAFRLPGYYGRTFRAFEIMGDSMQPGIRPGDYIVGGYEESLTHIRSNHIYVAVLKDGSIVAKRIVPLQDNEYEFRSDNAEFAPYKVSAADIAQIWHAEGRITKQFDAPGDNRFENLEQRLARLEKQITR
ncbi:MAG: helix-turn-helix domain-containing protein [Bacteroidetes bacterium]|nr:helix-turn-helix domain-containing protein [Bacteroidota bacterium]